MSTVELNRNTDDITLVLFSRSSTMKPTLMMKVTTKIRVKNIGIKSE